MERGYGRLSYLEHLPLTESTLKVYQRRAEEFIRLCSARHLDWSTPEQLEDGSCLLAVIKYFEPQSIEAALVTGLSQLHVHVYLPAAGSEAAVAPGARSGLGGSASGARREVIQSSDDIRHYTVWHIPGHPGIHGIFTGPHPLAWRSIATFLPEGRLPGSGAALCRQRRSAHAGHRAVAQRLLPQAHGQQKPGRLPAAGEDRQR
jgi:hypothetical protein